MPGNSEGRCDGCLAKNPTLNHHSGIDRGRGILGVGEQVTESYPGPTTRLGN